MKDLDLVARKNVSSELVVSVSSETIYNKLVSNVDRQLTKEEFVNIRKWVRSNEEIGE